MNSLKLLGHCSAQWGSYGVRRLVAVFQVMRRRVAALHNYFGCTYGLNNEQRLNSTRFKAHLQLALILPWLIAAVSCTPKTPIADTAKPNADSIASRGGGCPEGPPCKRIPKPKEYDQYIALPPKLPFDQSIALGKQLLNAGNTTSAIDNFKQALLATGSDAAKQQAVYGNLGLAYIAASDNPTAQAYLEKAGAKEQAPAWIKDAYKHLLASQTLMTVEYMEQKLQADNKIEHERAMLRALDQGFSCEGFIGIGDLRPFRGLVREHRKPTNTCFIDDETFLDIRIIIAVNRTELTPEGQKQADELGKFLQQQLQDRKQVAVLVGHTDIIGSQGYNDRLSEKRAAAVKHYLESKFPDLKGKLTELGMGKRQPLFKETDEASQSLNRRVEVRLSRTAE